MKLVLVHSIRQKDDHTFTIEWSDGEQRDYRLSTLQKNCPCALCVDEKTGVRRDSVTEDNVRAHRIVSVGRYALRVAFTSGCSLGIYDFEMLRNL